MNLDTKITFPSYVMFQEFDDEAVLLDIRSQEHFGLDPIGSLFVKELHTGISIQEASLSILDIYDVTREQLQVDLSALLDSLLKHELIQIA